MTQKDRRSLRLFYQTLISSSATDAQIALYHAMVAGPEARKKWLETYGTTIGVPEEIVAILSSTDHFSRDDIIYIAAVETAPAVAPVVQSIWNKIWSVLLAPFRWLGGK